MTVAGVHAQQLAGAIVSRTAPNGLPVLCEAVAASLAASEPSSAEIRSVNAQGNGRQKPPVANSSKRP
jgi:hypothetical protein